MAESPIQITQGSGTNIDVVQPGGGSNNRQVVVVGDPNATLAAAIANVSNGQLSVGATLYGGINVSLAGTNVSLQGTPNVAFASGATVTAQQGTSPWLTNASIVGTPGVNASIAGTVPVSGNVGLVANTTITAYQGTSPWLTNASIVGTPNVNITGEPTVLASITGQVPVTASISGTVPVSGTFWQANQPVSASIIGQQFATVSIAGQIPVTASIAGIVTVAGSFAINAAPTITALQGNAPWSVTQGANSTITAFQGGNYTVTLAGNVSIGSISVSTNSSITAFQGGAPWLSNVSVIGTVPVSGFPTAVNVSLLAPATVTLSGSIGANVSLQGTPNVAFASGATVTANQGGSPWNVNASILGIYADGATTASLSGMAVLWRDANGVVHPATPANGLPVVATLAGGVTIGTPTVNQGTNPWVVNATQAGAWTVAAHNVSIAGNITLGALNINNIGAGNNIGNVVISLGANATLGLPVQIGTNSTLTAFQGGAWIANVSIVGGTVSLAGTPTVMQATNSTITAFPGINPWPVTVQPGTGGWKSFVATPLAATIVSISHAAGEFGGYMLMNTWTSPAYLQVFDATAAVTLGLNAPTIVLPLPANAGTAADGIAANLELANGAKISNGIKVAATISASGATLVPTQLNGTIWYN